MNENLLPAEKVGIAQIRIRNAGRGTAVLGSFVAADKLLKAWADGRQCRECEFEIRYLDGSRLSGQYPMWQKSTARQSLGAHLRRVLASGQADERTAALRFDTAGGKERFLDQYEVEDFAPS
ncbi:hypothetical protein IP92_00964 [Pseudoduganella flava]|uniref:Uncharacterized protein n=1 Tax=Pseudoduganella flava TaxID=871742 RepID=A0A562PZC5_9BURK|nr:hypothetical protein [Pseudoduganella flava]QGZ38682.1 hypothetical protein GO485_06180 [Pseudoduganella flava]TWI49743.1 hypothetical protein IP92_00964 [Pseudoduganella flava]